MSAIATIEDVLISGDLSGLNPEQRVTYYQNVCKSLDLNPLTKPFEYLKLNGKLILYARRDAAEQLRRRDKISTKIVRRGEESGCYVVEVEATTPEGRVDTDVGSVWIENLAGEVRANAIMKCITKAKRRATLSICGLGMLDETEVDSIAPVMPHRKAVAAPAPDPGEDPEDAPTVNAYLTILGECRNRSEAEDVWAKAKADGKLSEGGLLHLKDIYGTTWKALPKAREAGEEG